MPLRRSRTVLGVDGDQSLAIVTTDNGYRAMVLNEQAPVTLNGQPLLRPVALSDGDTLVVDGVAMRFELG